jgi:hypothetical protein
LTALNIPSIIRLHHIKKYGGIKMAQKINLAVLNKKKEELDQKEMHKVRSGHGCPACAFNIDNSTALEVYYMLAACQCGSIWVVEGLVVVP